MILKLFLYWRLGLILATVVGSLFFTLIPNGGLGAIGPGKEFNYWASWAQWDGGHYYTIATEGYVEPRKFAFFPLYPVAVKLLSIVFFGNAILAGLVISNAAFLTFLYVLKKVVTKQFGEEAGINTIITYLLFPTTYFAVAFYSESIFLLLVALVLWAIQNKKIYWAAALVSAASLSRLMGVFLILPIIATRNIKAIGLSLVGIVVYCSYLNLRFGDPFYFSTVQSYWHRQFTNPITTIYSYFVVNPWHKPFNDYLDLFLTLGFTLILLLGIKKIPLSWSIFGFLTILLPASTGTLTSMPRYLLATFPVFILAGIYLKDKTVAKIVVWFVMLLLQIILAMMFVNGHWTA